LTPELLRNGYNAERPIQIRLELGLAECRQLQHWLTDLVQSGSVAAERRPELQNLLVKLNEATDQATRLTRCPVCQAWFAQGTLGRSAQYCGPACKQKAYRQRINARKRQRPTSRRRH
jgi:hypothetical protein